MARGRMLSAEASLDADLNRVSKDAQLLYLLAIPHLDRDGLMDGRPDVLCGKAIPLRREMHDDAHKLIGEWVTIGLVIRYGWKDGPILHFKGFRRHNSNIAYANEAASRFPPPPGWIRTRQGIVPEDEEACFRLADDLDTRSSYRKALLSQVSREFIATISREPREEDQDQDQDQNQLDDDDDHSYTQPSRVVGGFKGGGRTDHRLAGAGNRTSS